MTTQFKLNSVHSRRRGGVRKDRETARPITVWFRKADADLIDKAVEMDGNTDRSKFIRTALRAAVDGVLARV